MGLPIIKIMKERTQLAAYTNGLTNSALYAVGGIGLGVLTNIALKAIGMNIVLAGLITAVPLTFGALSAIAFCIISVGAFAALVRVHLDKNKEKPHLQKA